MASSKVTIRLLSILLTVVSLVLFICSTYLGTWVEKQQQDINGVSSPMILLRQQSYSRQQHSKELLTTKKSYYANAKRSTTTDHDVDTSCAANFELASRDQTPGLSEESLLRSRAWVGNRERLHNVAAILSSGQQELHVVAFGGSITQGHGVAKNFATTKTSFETGPYPELLETWLNSVYYNNDNGKQQKQKQPKHHRVFNMAASGADICALAKRMNLFLRTLQSQQGAHPDMFLLEFAVNDYQGQDHIHHAVSKTDVFFDGFQELALCAEVVVNKLLRTYPTAAVMFVEFRTGIMERKTATMLHMGVAMHYEVPVISYAEAVFPEYFRLVSLLNASDHYTVRKGETILPFPYGCAPCRPEAINEFFRHKFNPKGKHCRSVCDLIDYNPGFHCDQMYVPPGEREYCHPAIFAVDAVHPSALGHGIAKDLIAHAISLAVRDFCNKEPIQKHVLPLTGWLGTPKTLEARGKFLLVNDTEKGLLSHPLVPSRYTKGFVYTSDVKKGFEKYGWIATNEAGNETIEFEIDLPERPCYAVHVAILRSYAGMGQLEVEVVDKKSQKVTSTHLDGLWKSTISVWSDNQVTKDGEPGCTGQCTVRIKTKPQVSGRDGNKVKILTLSVRECVT